MVDQSPEDIRARTDKIATIDVPDGFEPERGIQFDLPFMGELGNFVVFKKRRARRCTSACRRE